MFYTRVVKYLPGGKVLSQKRKYFTRGGKVQTPHKHWVFPVLYQFWISSGCALPSPARPPGTQYILKRGGALLPRYGRIYHVRTTERASVSGQYAAARPPSGDLHLGQRQRHRPGERHYGHQAQRRGVRPALPRGHGAGGHPHRQKGGGQVEPLLRHRHPLRAVPQL